MQDTYYLHNCHVCGNHTTCSADDTASGKPICSWCRRERAEAMVAEAEQEDADTDVEVSE